MKRVIFSEWALEWVESKRMYIKESTYANYKLAIMNHLIPEFGNLYIDEITRKMSILGKRKENQMGEGDRKSVV